MKINKEAYQQLIKEDIQWLLKNTERDLEQDHIIDVLIESVKLHYPKYEYCDIEFNKWLKSDIRTI